MRYATLLLTLACSGSSGGTTPSDDTPIEVRLERPEHVGRRFRVYTRATNSQLEALTGPDGRTQERRSEVSAILEGEVQVVALDDNGGQLEFQLTLNRFEVEVGGESQSPIPQGTVLRVVRGQPSRILIDGEDAQGGIAEALGLVLPDGPDRDDDAIFGTNAPQNVESSWPIDATTTTAMMRAMHIEADDSAIDGTMRMAERSADSYRVVGSLDISSLRLGGLPANATLESGSMHASFMWLMPTDPDAQATERRTDMRMDMRMHVTDESGESGTLVIRNENHRESQLEELADGSALEPSPPAAPRTSNFGTLEVDVDFEPNPMRVQGSSGGPVDAAGLDESCAGWISDVPDHLLAVQSELADVRLMAFSPRADVTMVVQHPDGSYTCSDDDEGTDPIVSITLAPGEHKVWVGSAEEGDTAGYVLGLTTIVEAMPSTLTTPTGLPVDDEAEDEAEDDEDDEDEEE